MAGRKKTESKSKSDKQHRDMKRDESGTKGGEAKRNEKKKEDMVVDEFWAEDVSRDDELL